MILFLIFISLYTYLSQKRKKKKKFIYVRGYYGLMAMLSFLFEEKLGLNPLLPLSKKKKKNPLLPSLVINKDIYIYIYIYI